MPRLPRLTELSHCAGCAAKLRPDLLAELLKGLPQGPRRKEALVGFDTSDDAAVYQLTPELAVVETVDFFPPVVDDPYVFGQVAAANALSDIWAMGAKPLFALNLVGFPVKTLPRKMLAAILAGGADKAAEAGIPILGGHSIDDAEPKYGLAVTGVVHPRKVLRNDGGQPGDLLVLTKPLGVGIVTTAIKRKLAPKSVAKDAVRWMTTLNRAAGEAFASGAFRVHALTDVTGFGLLGHLWEMCAGAKVRAEVWLEAVPLLAGAPALAEAGVVPGGTKNNLSQVENKVRFPKGFPLAPKLLLADAQTNGGLLAAIPRPDVQKALFALERAGVQGHVVGELQAGRPAIKVV